MMTLCVEQKTYLTKRIFIKTKKKLVKDLLGKRRFELCSLPLDSRLATDESPLEYVSSVY